MRDLLATVFFVFGILTVQPVPRNDCFAALLQQEQRRNESEGFNRTRDECRDKPVVSPREGSSPPREPLRTFLTPTKQSQRLDKYELGQQPGAAFHRIVVCPSGQRLLAATGWYDSTATIWNLANWEQIRTIEFPQGIVVDASQDLSKIAVAMLNHTTVEIWDAMSGHRSHTLLESNALRGHPYMTHTKATFSNNAKLLATARFFEKTLELWDTDTWEIIATFRHRPESRCAGACFSRDDTLLATWYTDQLDEPYIHIYDMDGCQLKSSITAQSPLSSVAFSPDGTRIVAGSFDGFTRVWDIASGTEVIRLNANSGKGSVHVAISPTGNSLITGGTDGIVRVWDPSGRIIETLQHPAPVIAVRYFPQGELFAVGDPNGRITIWDAAKSHTQKKP